MDAIIYLKVSGFINNAKIWKVFVLITFFALFFALGNEVSAQVKVIGHVYAEIVEPTSLTVNSDYSSLRYKTVTDSSEVELAEVALSSSSDTEVAVNVKSASLVSSNGESYDFDTSVCEGCSQNETLGENEKVFLLTGTPSSDIWSENNSYLESEYEVTFIYN